MSGCRLPRWKVAPWVGIVSTFYFVTIAWTYFRAPDIATAHRILLGPLSASWDGFGKLAVTHAFELFLLVLFAVTHRYDAHARVRIAAHTWNKAILWTAIGIMFVIAMTVSQGSPAKFIYFEF